MDQLVAATAAASRETQCCAQAQIDRAGDAATTQARKLVPIQLDEYGPYDDADPGDACWSYRKKLERRLGGAIEVAQALQASALAWERKSDELTISEPALAETWIAATRWAMAQGIAGLAAAHTGWFEVRHIRAAAPDS